MAVVEINNRLLFPLLQPVITRDFTVMFVGFSVAFFPILILAGAKLQPRQQLLDGGAATFVEVLEIIDDGVTCVIGGTH